MMMMRDGGMLARLLHGTPVFELGRRSGVPMVGVWKRLVTNGM